jgi:hypothetical protein
MASTEDNLQQQEDGILSTLLPALSRFDRFLEGAVREVQFSNGLNVASSIQGPVHQPRPNRSAAFAVAERVCRAARAAKVREVLTRKKEEADASGALRPRWRPMSL